MPCFQEGRLNNLIVPGVTVVAKESFKYSVQVSHNTSMTQRFVHTSV